jgi:ABC-2 type transport system permease protein
MFATMMASIFVGTLVQPACTIIAEDREKKSLRFLIIAGVKPLAYLLGIGGATFTVSVFSSLALGYIGGFSPDEFMAFMAVMMSGAVASIILGATIGIYSKNQQAATGLSTPIAVGLGIAPMVTLFNERAERVICILYTQQINVVVNDFSAGLARPLAVIWINIIVLAVLFVISYVGKGLRE